MKLLLDSQCLLWTIYSPERLSRKAQTAISDNRNQLLVSHATLWELSLKTARGRLPEVGPTIQNLLREMEYLQASLLPIRMDSILAAERLPMHHADPFDRLLLAQAQMENVKIVSADRQFKQYDVSLIW